MRRHGPLLMAVLLATAACGDSSEETKTTSPPLAPAPTTAAPVAATAGPVAVTAAPAPTTAPPVAAATAPPVTEPPGPGATFALTFVTVGPGGREVIITNVGAGTGSLAGHFLCQFPSYARLPEVELAPGEFVAVSLGGDVFAPPPGARQTFSVDIGAIRPDSGEIGLYSSAGFDSAAAIVDYVEWGNSGHVRSGVAVAAGIWNSGDFVPTTEGTTYMFAAEVPSNGAEDWEAG